MCVCVCVCVCVWVTQLCLTLWDLMDCSPPGSSVHGILQVRILELVAIPFSRWSPHPGIELGYLLHCRQILYHLSHKGSPYVYSPVINLWWLFWMSLDLVYKASSHLYTSEAGIFPYPFFSLLLPSLWTRSFLVSASLRILVSFPVHPLSSYSIYLKQSQVNEVRLVITQIKPKPVFFKL